MKDKFVFLGMGIQASVAGILDLFGIVHISGGQQIISAVLFFVLFVISRGKKIKE